MDLTQRDQQIFGTKTKTTASNVITSMRIFEFEKYLIEDFPHILNKKYSPLVQEMSWRRQGVKPFSEAMVTNTPDAKWSRSVSMCWLSILPNTIFSRFYNKLRTHL